MQIDKAIKLYNEGYSIKEVAEELQSSYKSVRNALKSAGVRIRTPAESLSLKSDRKKLSKKTWCTKDWLTEHYINQNLAISEISNIVKFSQTSVYNQLKKHGLIKTSLERWKDPGYRKKMSSIFSKRWDNQEYKDKCSKQLVDYNNSERNKADSRFTTTKLWQDSEYRSKVSKSISDKYKEQDTINLHREYSKSLWNSEKYREKTLNALRDKFKDPDYLSKIKANAKSKSNLELLKKNRDNMPKVSALAEIVYGILDDLGIKYYREYNNKNDDPETKIGAYSIDCVIPRENKPDLALDFHGNYWHKNDTTSKCSYMANLPQYEYRVLWEDEIKCNYMVVDALKILLGIEIPRIEFKFDQLEIREISAPEYKLLLSKYHYLHNAGRGGLAYGLKHEGTLIAVCIFSSPIRQNIGNSLQCKSCEINELSRFCIDPRYQKKNLGSWFISRCIRFLKIRRPHLKKIITYADTTFEHSGSMYLACNFKFDRKIKPDYWYVKPDGWMMHKKTLWDHSKKMRMSEKEYAEKYSYTKVYGKEKLRFVYTI